jgi:hypothetical protein
MYDMGYRSYAKIACFLGAAYTRMLNLLRQEQVNRNNAQLLEYWHNLMQNTDNEKRALFFREVVAEAKRVRRHSPSR